MWIFGYGSLVWKVDFPYETKLVGYIKGYTRRFWQASIDHRGTPEKPGRVVTLIPTDDPEDIVWGIAYEVSDEKRESVIRHLDYRERGGYERVEVKFYPKDTRISSWVLAFYLGNEENPFYTGPTSEDEIAQVIATSHGPSGSNWEYLCKLHESLRELGAEDFHVRSLSNKVRNILEVA